MPKSSETYTLSIHDKREKKINRTDLAYTAGFLDGEATICANKKNKNDPHNCVIVRVTFYQTDLKVIQWLAERYGGRIGHYGPRGLGKKESYRLAIRTRDIKWFLKLMIPFLKVKQRQARLALILLALTERKASIEKKVKVISEISRLNTG